MLKNKFKSLLLVAMLFSRAIVGAEELMDITSRLYADELNLVDSDVKAVYLTPQLIEALNSIEVQEDSALKNLKALIHSGHLVAPYESTLNAVDHAIKMSQDHASYNALCSYKTMLQSGDATLVIEEEEVDRSSRRTRKFRRICVRSVIARCIRANSGNFCNLAVNGVLSVNSINGATCGVTGSTCAPLNSGPLLINSNVNICGLINGATFPGAPFPTSVCTGTTPTAVFPSVSACGNVAFNTLTTPLNVVGARSEASLAVLREVINFGTLTPAAFTVAYPETVGNAIDFIGTVVPNAAIVANSGVGINPGVVTTVGGISLIANFTDVGTTGNILIQLPVTFAAFSSIPTVEVTASLNTPTDLNSATADTNALTISNVAVSASAVSAAGATINIIVSALGGGDFTDAATFNLVIAGLLNNLFNGDNLRLNIIVTGIVS